MSLQTYTVVGLGEILWDLLPDGRKLGGAPTNFAYHAQMLGARGVVVSRVGRDSLGDQIVTALQQLGLDAGYVAVDDFHATGTVNVTVDDNGMPDYVITEDVAWDYLVGGEHVLALAAQTDAVCFGSLAQRSPVSRHAICTFLQATPAYCLRIFDINLRQQFFDRETVETALELATVLKLNDEELPAVARLLGLPQTAQTPLLAELARRYGLTLIALTRGSLGSLLYTPDRCSSHGGYPTAVADSVGAGDAFTAALAVGLLRGQDLARINEHASRLASYVCSQHGATPSIPKELRTQTSAQPGEGVS